MSNSIAIELRNISKVFGPVVANCDVSLSIKSGSIHAIIGENGAGKSTAMKILYGIHKPTSGTLCVRGEERRWKSPREAIAAGIGMVHQHFMLARPVSALDNMIVGAEPTLRFSRFLPEWIRIIDRETARQEIERLMEDSSLHVDLDSAVERLSVGAQQRIEILKTLYRKADILILDEPTAVLTPQEVEEFFGILRKLKSQGKTIILITHKLREVLRLADRITVFRSGKVVGELDASAANEEILAELMVGRKVLMQLDSHRNTPSETTALELEQLSFFPTGLLRFKTKPRLSDLSFAVHAGEIVGIAGVEGNGQSELLKILCHPATFFSKRAAPWRAWGMLRIFGKNATRFDINAMRQHGMGIIFEDRQKEGLLLDSPLDENLIFGYHRRKLFARGYLLKWRAIRNFAQKALNSNDVRPADLNRKASELSGGNQQKLVIAREMVQDPKFLLAAHPTRGVDVGAIESIHQKIMTTRNAGMGVLLISSELEELTKLSDRILVMYEGRIIAQFSRDQFDEAVIGRCMGGGNP